MEEVPKKQKLVVSKKGSKYLTLPKEPADQGTPMALIQMAINQPNFPIENLERLMALQERWEKNQAKKAFIDSMAKFQSECPMIEKTKKVYEKNDPSKIRYSYAPLESIVEQVKEIISKHGFSYGFDEDKDEQNTKIICTVTHQLGHSEQTTFKIPVGSEQYMTDVQKHGARMTFGKRYAFCNAFGIMTGDEDTDAQNTSEVAGNTDEMFKQAQKMINEEKNQMKILTYRQKIESSKKYSELQKAALIGLTDKRLSELQHQSNDIPVIEEGAGTSNLEQPH